MRITKRFGRRISHDYQSWEFLTEISQEVDIKTKEELITESDKLFNAVKNLTLKDMEQLKDQIQPLKIGGK